jgi:hypothetical protein
MFQIHGSVTFLSGEWQIGQLILVTNLLVRTMLQCPILLGSTIFVRRKLTNTHHRLIIIL